MDLNFEEKGFWFYLIEKLFTLLLFEALPREYAPGPWIILRCWIIFKYLFNKRKTDLAAHGSSLSSMYALCHAWHGGWVHGQFRNYEISWILWVFFSYMHQHFGFLWKRRSKKALQLKPTIRRIKHPFPLSLSLSFFLCINILSKHNTGRI